MHLGGLDFVTICNFFSLRVQAAKFLQTLFLKENCYCWVKYPTILTTTAFTQLGGGGGAFVCVGMELLSSQNKTVPHPSSVDWLQFQCFFDLDFIYSWECRQNECELDFVSRGIIGVSRGFFFALTDIRVLCSCHPLSSQGLCKLWVGAVFLRVQKIMMERCSWECKRSWCLSCWCALSLMKKSYNPIW
jgi:hypothetical protein